METRQKEILLAVAEKTDTTIQSSLVFNALCIGLVEQIELLSLLMARFDALHKTVYQKIEASEQGKKRAVDGIDGMVEAFNVRLNNLEQSVQQLRDNINQSLFDENVGE